MTIDETLDRFLSQLRADGRSEHTVRQYQRHGKLFAVWADEAGLDDDVAAVSHEDIAMFFGSTAATKCTSGVRRRPTSGNALRSSIRGLFRYLHRAGYVATDPSRLLRQARCAAPPPRTLSADEEHRLFAAMEAADGDAARRDHAMFCLMREAGIRIGSALALDTGDVDLDRREITISTTKGARPERLPLSPRVAQVLREYLDDRDRSGPLFPSRAGQQLTARQVQRRLSQWCDRAGIRQISPHMLRHSFAMGLYEKTRDVLVVREALLHRSIGSTMVYARASRDDLRRALA